MIVRPYDDEDYKTLKGWYEKRKLPCPEKRFLPTRGFIIENLACGFLIQTDCRMGLLDFYIGNPDANKFERRRALYLITESLMKRAKSIGLLVVKCDTQNDYIKILATTFDFKCTGNYVSFFREI